MARSLLRWACAGLLALAIGSAAPSPASADELTGTLKKVNASGIVTIGYRESSLPFSYIVPGAKQPMGYAIDLCREIVDDMSKFIGRTLEIKFQPVTSANRFEAVTSGAIDLECGSTTANAERRKIVDFSPVTFVSATKLMVKAGSPVKSYRDLDGKKVVVTDGTTNEEAVKAIAERLQMNVTILKARDHADSFRMLSDGQADVFAGDDVLLYGLRSAAGDKGLAFNILPSALSYEPYGIMFRKDDPQLAGVVRGTFERLAELREGIWIYDRWFRSRLPTGERLDIPMSEELTHIWEVLGLPPE